MLIDDRIDGALQIGVSVSRICLLAITFLHFCKTPAVLQAEVNNSTAERAI